LQNGLKQDLIGCDQLWGLIAIHIALTKVASPKRLLLGSKLHLGVLINTRLIAVFGPRVAGLGKLPIVFC
jgi:hypothetical protein